ncbi:MAG: ATP-binding domain-containing protein [Thermoleophilaceae bacterium]|nr:ATP-binding domain-containing protein [Thermoleophilaceae bacterium]
MEALGWKVQSGRDVARLVPRPDNLSPVARMHPRSLLEEELKSTGEGKVFAALRDGLSDEWEVFHSASVVFRDHAAGAQDDALIVDEAQDLHGDWLEALTTTLRDEDESSAWLFTDDNQRVYDAILDVPREYRPFDLTVNCRNTQAIHREVMKLYEGEVVPEVKGPPGREIELHPTDDPGGTVKGVLARLCGQEEIPPQDVVVLSSHGLARSEVARGGGGSYSFVPEHGKLGKHVHFSSIRGFKGLEAPVVVLCELEDLDEESRDQQLYVALSRARNHCVVVAPKS